MLRYLTKFQQLLANYHVSEDSKQILASTELVLLLAASGSGRNTVIRELVKTKEYHFIISDTTRQPRVNDGVMEQNGVEYWFRDELDVLDDLQNGRFLEAELIHNQQVSGISMRELQNAHDEKRIAITDVDRGGLQNIVQAKPDAIAVLLLPPSFEEWQLRMLNRGEMTSGEHRRRLVTACQIFTMALENKYFKFVINNNVTDAVEQIKTLSSESSGTAQETAHQLASVLLAKTQLYLESN